MCGIGGYFGKQDAGRLEHPGRTRGALSADAALTPSPNPRFLGRGVTNRSRSRGRSKVEDLAYTRAESTPRAR